MQSSITPSKLDSESTCHKLIPFLPCAFHQIDSLFVYLYAKRRSEK